MDLSVIIPAYNRLELLRKSLQSVHDAIRHLDVEIVIVDDGSTEPIAEQLGNFLSLPLRVIRQANQGSAVAKDKGIREAAGRYTLVLDSDDFVHKDKFVAQVAKLDETLADVCYTDYAVAEVPDSGHLSFKEYVELPLETRPAEFYLKLQPLCHMPMYRTSYLQQHLANPLIPPTKELGPVGDVWLYYNLCVYPAKIVKLDGHFAIYTRHTDTSYSSHWESLRIASLRLMLAFAENCPQNETTREARVNVGEAAFAGWRSLPRHFSPDCEEQLLAIWRRLPKRTSSKLGGKTFQSLAKAIGVERTARMLRKFQTPHYSLVRTLTDEELANLGLAL